MVQNTFQYCKMESLEDAGTKL